MDGATSRRRGSRASTAISAGEGRTPRSTSSRQSPTTISAWSDRRRSQLLNNDYRSIYTWPQTTKNQAQLIAMNGRYSVSDHWTVQSNLYLRKFQQAHVDGNAAEVERCSGQAANPLFNTLCLEDDGFPRQPAANFQLLNQNNRPINCPPGPGNTCATTPWGTVDRTWTNAITTGASLQAHQRRQDIRPRQLLHDRWQRRPQQDRFPRQQRARLHLSRFLRWPQRCCAGDGTDRPHRRQYRLCAGQPRAPGIPITASTPTTPSISPIGCR